MDWTLNRDVNILVGENGTGKSTMLRKILVILHVKPALDKESKRYIGVRYSDIVMKVSEESPSNEIRIQINNIEYISEGDFIEKKPGVYRINEVGEKEKDFMDLGYEVHYLNTFDNKLIDALLNNKEKSRIKSYLDLQLDEVIDDYVEYQLNQNKKIRKGKTEDEVFAKYNYFIKTVNNLFLNTSKKIDEEENRLAFLLEDGTKLSPYELSSGEKQLLIILLTVLNQDEKPSILLMDEPEISLHTSWQHELISILRTLNPNCQLIIVTHSPSIFIDGHKEKITWMEDITTNNQAKV